MLAKSMGVVLLWAVLGVPDGYCAPCGAPGGLCAPIESITSLPPSDQQEPPGQQESPAMAPRPDPVPVPVPAPARIALLLPLRSETLGPAAESLRAGFLAGYERERDGLAVSVIDSGEAAQDVLASYAQVQEQYDVIVGPLTRSAVTALAGSALVRKPTIALNYPEGRGQAGETVLPPRMLAIGLSIEDEARQLASWAAAEHPGADALILHTGLAWQRRAAMAFAQRWQRLGLGADSVELRSAGAQLSEADLAQLRLRVLHSPPALLFAALDAGQARQLRAALGTDLPLYGTSALNPGRGREAGPELDGARLLDLPWQVQRDHPAVMVYPHPVLSGERADAADLQRLYALGIDAFRVAREIALHPSGRFVLDGVTGRLAVSFDTGANSFERVEQAAAYRDGVALPLP